MNILAQWNALPQIVTAAHELFGGDQPDDSLKLYQAAARAVLVYLIGVAIVRIGKSRLIARLTPLDIIVGYILGSLLSRGITGHASVSGTAAASAALVAAHWLLTRLSCHWHAFGDLVKGRSHVIVKDGQPLLADMRRSHLSIHDLDEQLRMKGIDDIHQVRLAFKERSGEVSVLKRNEPPRILEIHVKDGVQTVRLQLEQS